MKDVHVLIFGITTLSVLGVASHAVAAPWALVVVASMAFRVFVITIGLIGRQQIDHPEPRRGKRNRLC